MTLTGPQAVSCSKMTLPLTIGPLKATMAFFTVYFGWYQDAREAEADARTTTVAAENFMASKVGEWKEWIWQRHCSYTVS